MLMVNHLTGFGAVADVAPVGPDAFTVMLLHCDGADGSTTITDSSPATPHTITAGGNAQIDTAFSKFSGASLLFDGNGDSISFDGSNADFTFAGDFTIDFWIRSTSSALEGSAQQRLLSFGAGATNLSLSIDNSPAGLLLLETGAGVSLITGTTNVSDSTWRHIAIPRAGTDLRLFVNGVQEGSTVTNSTTFVGAAPSYFARYQASAIGHYTGHMDEIRISKGIARWTANFTPPAAPY